MILGEKQGKIKEKLFTMVTVYSSTLCSSRSLPSDARTYLFKNVLPGRSYTVTVTTELSNKQSDPVSGTFMTCK